MPQLVSRFPGLERRLALVLVICGALGGLGWLWWGCVRQPEVYFLPRRAPAEWIIYPSGPGGAVHPRLEMNTLFRRPFTLERTPAKALLSIAGLRYYTLSINGKPAAPPVRRGLNWKQADEFEVAPELRAGENQIQVMVFNTNGPPVLWLSLDTGGSRLNSDETWQASYGGAVWRQARLASKPKAAIAGSPVCGGEEPWPSLRGRWLTLLLFTLLSGAAYWFINWRARLGISPLAPQPSPLNSQPIARELLPVLVLAGFWVALFANNLGPLPNLVGYDVDGHIAYISYIQEHHSLPRADEGWEMFQPPLYYLLGAGLLSALSLSVTQDGGLMALRVMGMGIGIAHFVLVWLSLGLLFPGDRSKPRWGLIMAAALPPVLYLSQYVSNEGLAAAMVSGCVYLTLRMLRQERASWKAWTGLGLCLGAALLTKPTALLVVPAVAGALLLREIGRQQEESRKPKAGILKAQPTLCPTFPVSRFTHHASRITLLLTLCLAVCGWHYARLWTQYGNPLIGVWDPRLGFSWWQDDGYRTGAFYLRFGAVLAHPWFSSFKGFADGLYATLWGDGLFGGMADAVARPPWNYDLMAVGYWLALVPTLAVMVGGILVLVRFLRCPSAEGFLVLGLGFLVTLALVHMSISLPYQCHVKAFYGLCALVPLCACGAWGLDALCRWSGKLRSVVCILFGVWAINSYAALWISGSTVAAKRSRAHSLWKEHRRLEAVESLKAGLERDPNLGAEAQSFLAYLLMETGETQDAARLVAAALRQDPGEPKGQMVAAALLTREQRFDEAIEHARRAVQLAPSSESAYEQLASLLVGRGRSEEGIAVAREGLAVAPFSAELRFDLGTALALRGETAEGIEQLQLACGIKPKWAEPRFLLGSTLAKQGRLEAAGQCLREGLRLEPGNAGAHCQLAAALSGQHETAKAIVHFAEALRLEPDFAEALNNLAWIRAAHSRAGFRDGAEAVRLGERACKVTQFKEPVMVGTLAAAYAEAGRFEEAVATARKARELALAAGQQTLADENQKLIQLFSARQSYRDPAQP
jgi:tetratricopeptide (TPR) repeat protein